MAITLTTKEQLLDRAGYAYSFEREIYVSRRTRTAFSLEFVEDRDEQIIERCLAEAERQPNPDSWTFHFVVGPSDSVKRELERILR